MAQLRDTLIQGSARVTDTLYTTNIAGGTVTAPIYWTGGNVALPEKTNAEYFLAIDAFASGGKTYWVSKANTLSSIGAAASGHNHNTTYLRLDGSNIMTGTLAIKPASGEGGELHLCASTANTTEAGIVLDHLSNSLRIFGIASADGTTKTGVGTPLVIDPYAKTITGGYTITGALTGHASSDLALTGGKMTGRIYREGVASSWHKGRENSLVAISTKNGYSPLASMKTTNGSWEIGTYDNADFTDDLLFSYIKDTTYSGTTAKTDAQIRFYESGGALFVGQTTITYNPGATDSTAKGMINLTSSAPATVAKSGSYSWGINHLVPNLASGGHTCLITGMGNGTNNSAALEFNYVGSNHADNSVGLGLYGNNQLLTINKAGTVKIKATTASTSSTTGALVVGGGIGTGAASFLTGSVHITGTAASNPLIVRGISGCHEDGIRGDTVTDAQQGLYLNLAGGPVYVGDSAATDESSLIIQYTSDASSSNTGALRVSGGVGIAKKLYVGSTASFGGAISTANNTLNNIGDDAQLGDQNISGTICIKGKNGNTSIRFLPYSGTAYGNIIWDGTKFNITSTTPIDASISGTSSNVTGTVAIGHGGTGITAYAVGDILYCSAANTLSKLAKGTAGQFLRMGTANVPIWGDGSEVTLNGTPTTTPSFYAPTTAGTNGQILMSNGTGAPAWTDTTSITSVGTITSGTWQGGVIASAFIGAHTHNYLPLTGGDVTGLVNIKMAVNAGIHVVDTGNNNLTVGLTVGSGHQNHGVWSTGYAPTDSTFTSDGKWVIYRDSAGDARTQLRLFGAVWNDYAEYRKQAYKITPGHVVIDLDNGLVIQTEQRLMPGAQVVSDTFGFAIGENDECKTPLAVSGRVLVYPCRNRHEYHAGMAVCSAPNGTVDIMTREEIKEYPDAIVGIVSEIPQYEEWGEKPVKVDGRIWIKVK